MFNLLNSQQNKDQEIIKAALKNTYRYKHNTERKIPRPIRIFGASEMTTLFRIASEKACKNGKKNQPELFSFFGTKKEENTPVVADFWQIKQLLITGASGFGKTKGLQGVLFSLMWGNHPGNLQIIIFDIKREFHKFNNVNEVNKEPSKFIERLTQIQEEMRSRYRTLEESGSANIEEYNKVNPVNTMPYIVLVVDEYASTCCEVPEFDKAIEFISCTGRAAGILLIISTQRADHKSISSRIKANMTSSLSFAQRDEINARIAGAAGASQINTIGTAILNATGKSIILQTPKIEESKIEVYAKNIEERIGRFAKA